MRLILRLARLLLVALALLAGVPGTPIQPPAALAQQSVDPPDYEAWEPVATRAEEAIAAGRASDEAFTSLRAELVSWREQFLAAQGVNASRIETVQGQIEALGAAPGDGETEDAEIAGRRADLASTLSELRAPVLRAEEAFRRAEGLIREIDTILRERQADALLLRDSAPVNPAQWRTAWSRIVTSFQNAIGEVRENWESPARRAALRDDLPVILGLLIVALVLLTRGRHWMEALTVGVFERFGSRVVGLLVSLGQVVVPLAGVLLLVVALLSTNLLGLRAIAVVQALPLLVFSFFFARWVAGRVFPKSGPALLQGELTPQDRRAMRARAGGLGFLIGAAEVIDALAQQENYSGDLRAVLYLPVFVLIGWLLFQSGRVLQRLSRSQKQAAQTGAFQSSFLAFTARATMTLGLLGPVLAAAGYTVAAELLLLPAAKTLALAGVLLVTVRLVSDLYMMLTGASEEEAAAALVPTLVSFAILLGAIPVLALIWGARVTDLTEIWSRFQQGFALGDTRIQPTDFLVLLVVFAIGYTGTRAVQSGLKNAVLPKTRLDAGGRNAIVSGVGYLGIFLAAIIAITAAGINLSALAVVAGALSVGIGFGLQNVVQNFVAGIILLVERPVAEGDWIEVGGHEGIVKAISVRSTRIETWDKNEVILPNADFISGAVKNWTRGNLIGRIVINVGVAYGSDTRKVEQILREVAAEHPLIMVEPEPGIDFVDFGASSLDFRIRAVLADINYGLSVRTELRHRIAERFAEEGIEIPFAQRDVWLRNPEALTGTALAGPGAAAAKSQPLREPDLHVPGDSDAEPDGDGR